ncbi:MAG: hypothetical protein K6A44_00525 [bacterium]|nr:hypothetical protein [bacterium]
MKKIILAMMVCFMFAGAGYCAPNHHNKHHKDHVAAPPPPPQHNIVTVRRHKHHVPLYPYEYYPAPYGTQVIINTGGFSVGYGTGYGGSYINYGGSFRL